MKVYVVKELRTWGYLTETRDFINDLRQAELFFDYDCAKSFSPYGCEVVEVELMEAKNLSDYTKQVRKEVCEEIAKKMENKLVRMQPDGEFGTRLAIDWYDINKVLDQIKENRKWQE